MCNAIYFRLIAAILALVLLLEPTAITVLQAQEIPQPRISSEKIDEIPGMEGIVPPVDYLEYMLKFRGKSKSEVEARAWGEWMMTLNSGYMLMDDGSSDVISFYQALKVIRDNNTVLSDISDVIKTVSKFTTLSFAFLFRSRLLQQSGNLISGFMKLTNMAQKAQNWVENNKILSFMEYTAPPPCWDNPEVAGQGFKSYWRWVTGKNTGAPDAVGELTKAQGIARSIGIGLVVFGLAVDAYGIIRSEDRQGGRFTSYSLTKHYVGAVLGLAFMVSMFCVPIIGQIAMIAGCLWAITVLVGDVIGSFNKRWKEAYKNSYWYLYENDPEFRSFYDGRSNLNAEEKAVSLKLVEKNLAEFMAGAPKQGDDAEARNSRVYVALEKQGLLVSYYAQKGFTLPDFKLERLQQLWQMKADYMSWKPTESEAEKEKSAGFWGKIGNAINPMTYISWVGDKVKSSDYRETIAQYNIQKVFFNPDYVLLKKFQNYTTAQKLQGGIYDLVGLRIEQSPFNYIPLVGIDSSAWNEELLKEAFNADGFLVGQKELVYFREQIKMAAEKADKFIEGLDETVKKINDKDLVQTAKIRAFLVEFLSAYQTDENRENAKLFKTGSRIFGWKWNDKSEKKSPVNVLRLFKKDFEQSLFCEPISLGQKAAETVVLLTTVKQQMDMARLMKQMGDEKEKALNEFDSTFTNAEIKRYLKDGSFLDVKGGTVMDWFSEIYSAHDEMEKYLNLFRQDVEKYTGIADSGNSNTRERFLWFDKEITHPAELLRKLNVELSSWKDVVNNFGELAQDIDLKVTLAEENDFAEKVFAEYSLDYELVPLDPEQPIDEDQN